MYMAANSLSYQKSSVVRLKPDLNFFFSIPGIPLRPPTHAQHRRVCAWPVRSMPGYFHCVPSALSTISKSALISASCVISSEVVSLCSSRTNKPIPGAGGGSCYLLNGNGMDCVAPTGLGRWFGCCIPGAYAPG